MTYPTKKVLDEIAKLPTPKSWAEADEKNKGRFWWLKRIKKTPSQKE